MAKSNQNTKQTKAASKPPTKTSAARSQPLRKSTSVASVGSTTSSTQAPSKKTAAARAHPVSSGDEAPPPKKSRKTTVEEVEDVDAQQPGKKKDTAIELSTDEDSGDEVPGESAEAELIRLQKRWVSPIYGFFSPTVDIVYCGKRRAHQFSCAKSSCDFTTRRFLDTGDRSTGNMRKHALACWGNDVVERAMETASPDEAREKVVKSILETGRISTFFSRKNKQAVSYSHMQHTKQETRAEIVKWVCQSLRPFSIVKDEGFLSLMKTGRPGYYVPSPSTVLRDVKLVFARTRQRIAQLLQDYEGRLSFATDAWTSPNHRAFVAITVHLEVKGQPLRMLLDIVEVAKSHTGVNLAAAFAQVLQDFGIESKILSVTCDNASNNDTMTDHLAELLEAFGGQFARTRCFLHILNLSARSLIRQFDVKAVADAEEVDDDVRELLAHVQELEAEERALAAELGGEEPGADGEDELLSDDDDSWVDEVATLEGEELKEYEREIRPLKMVLTKMRRLAFKIIHSTTVILPAWKAILEELKLDEKLLSRDVKTRWNSTFDMLEDAITYRDAIDALCSKQERGLRAFELSAEEWTLAEQLRDTLKIYKDATLYFSRDTPSLAMVIPAMDHIDAHLTNSTRPSSHLHPAIQTALGFAKKTLNKYYKMSDMSATYRIAMVLHPGHKMRYFEQARWPAAWLKNAREMVREEYELHYASGDHLDDAGEEEEPSDHDVPLGANIFDHLPGLSALTSNGDDELTRYLATPPEPTKDAIAWWHAQRSLYPRLARMALDYLSIPATSVDVERTFSRGRRLLSHVRSRLSAQTTRAVMCVGDWVRLGIVRSEDVRAVSKLDEVAGTGLDYEMEDGWDRIEQILADQRSDA